MELFAKNFIGETVNAEKCELLNPQVLHFSFDHDKRILKATADEFLVIENRALGYKLKYLLTGFELDLNNSVCETEGYPYFEELAGSDSQQKKWESNRKKTYLSSGSHFFWALANNKIAEEGFQVYLGFNYRSEKKDSARSFYVKLSPKDSAYLQPNTYKAFFDTAKLKTLVFTPKITGKDSVKLDSLFVIYTGEKESALFYKNGNPQEALPFMKL
jgi:hypothetical protein